MVRACGTKGKHEKATRLSSPLSDFASRHCARTRLGAHEAAALLRLAVLRRVVHARGRGGAEVRERRKRHHAPSAVVDARGRAMLEQVLHQSERFVHFPPVLGAGGRVGPQAPPDDLPEQTYACQRVSVSARARRLCGCCMAWHARRGKHARTHARTRAHARTHAARRTTRARCLRACAAQPSVRALKNISSHRHARGRTSIAFSASDQSKEMSATRAHSLLVGPHGSLEVACSTKTEVAVDGSHFTCARTHESEGFSVELRCCVRPHIRRV